MANNAHINIGVGFNVDKSGLNKIKASLQDIQKASAKDVVSTSNLQEAEKELVKIKQTAAEVENALEKSFNFNLNALNVSKFNKELKDINVQKIQNEFSQLGTVGQNAFRNLTTEVLTTNVQLKQTSKFLDNMAQTFANTARWGFTSSVFNNLTGAVQQAYGYVKGLDSSLNDIRIVTGKSTENMKEFAKVASKTAKDLAAGTKDYTNASLIYYQQGLSDREVKSRTDTTMKAANVTGQSPAEVSEQLTAVWNGYKVQAQETEKYVDKLAATAATTAADLEELSTGMSKVASAASTTGVNIDQLSAQISTIISVTRQAPEAVGTALKTIFARLSDLKMGKTDEDGLGLGEVSGTLDRMGVHILDSTGNLREMGTVIEEIGAKWKTWNEAEQIAMAQVMAGKRQYNNLVALFENFDMYEAAKSVSENSLGTLQQQQEVYLESMEAHLQKLGTSAENVYDSLLDPEGLNPLIDALTFVTDLFGNFIDAIGGGGSALLLLGNIATKVFSKQITQGISNMITMFQKSKFEATTMVAEVELVNQFGEFGNKEDERYKKLLEMKRAQIDAEKLLTQEEKNANNELIKRTNEIYKQQDILKARKGKAEEIYSKVFKGTKINLDNLDEVDTKTVLADLDDKEKEIKERLIGITEPENVQGLYQKLYDIENEYNNDPTSSKKVENLKQAMDNLSAHVKNVLEQGSSDDSQYFSQENIKAIRDAQFIYKKALDASNNGLLDKNVEDAAVNLQNVYKKATQDAINKTKEAQTIIKNYAVEHKNLKNALDNSAEAQEQFQSQMKLRTIVNNVVQLAQAIGQVSMAFKSITNLGNIWNDDTLDDGEKILQTIMALTTNIPILLGLLSKIKVATEAIDNKKRINYLDQVIAKRKKEVDIVQQLTKEEKKRLGPELTKKAEERIEKLQKNIIINKTKESINKNPLDFSTTNKKYQWLSVEKIQKKFLENGLSEKDAQNEAKKFVKVYYEGLAKEGKLFSVKEDEQARKKKLNSLLSSLTNESQEVLSSGEDRENYKRYLIELQQEAETQKTITNAKKDSAETTKEDVKNTSNLKSTLKSIGASLLIEGGIALIGFLVQAFQNAANADEKLAEEAEENAQKMNDAYKSAAQAVEELKTSLAEWNKQDDSLDMMIKGTDEYTAALEKANEEAMKMLDTYGEIAGLRAGEDYEWVNGQLKISTSGQEKLQDAAKQQKEEAALAKASANVTAIKARANVTKEDLYYKDAGIWKDGAEVGEKLGGISLGLLGGGGGAAAGAAIGGGLALSGAALGATIGSAVPIIGTLIGGVLGGIVSLIAGFATQEAQATKEHNIKQYQSFAEQYSSAELFSDNEASKQLRENLYRSLEGIDKTFDEWNKELMEDKDKWIASFNELRVEQEKELNQYRQYFSQLSEIQEIGNQEVQDAVVEASSRMANAIPESEIKAIRDEVRVWYDDKDWNYWAEKMAEAQGGTFDKAKQEITIGNNVYTAEQWKTDAFIDQYARATLTSTKVTQNLSKTMETLTKTAANTGLSLKDLSNSFDGEVKLSESRWSAVKQAQTFDAEDIKNMGFDYAAAGYKSAEAAAESFRNAAKSYTDARDAIVKNSNRDTNGFIERLSELDLSNEALRTISDKISIAFEYGGNAGKKALEDVISQFGNNSESIENFANALASIDPSSLTFEQDLLAVLKEQGEVVNEDSEAWEAFIKTFTNAEVNASNFVDRINELLPALEKLHNVIENSNVGNIITKEDYDLLVKYSNTLSDFYIKIGKNQYVQTKALTYEEKLKIYDQSVYQAQKDLQQKIAQYGDAGKIITSTNALDNLKNAYTDEFNFSEEDPTRLLNWIKGSKNQEGLKALFNNRAIQNAIQQSSDISGDRLNEIISDINKYDSLEADERNFLNNEIDNIVNNLIASIDYSPENLEKTTEDIFAEFAINAGNNFNDYLRGALDRGAGYEDAQSAWLAQQKQALDITDETVEAYYNLSEELNNLHLNEDNLFDEIIVKNVEAQEAFDALSSDWESLQEQLTSSSDLEKAKGLGIISEQLSKIFGTRVDSKFIKQNIEQIQKYVQTGDKNTAIKLRTELTLDKGRKFGIDLNKLTDLAADELKKKKVGEKLSKEVTAEFISSLSNINSSEMSQAATEWAADLGVGFTEKSTQVFAKIIELQKIIETNNWDWGESTGLIADEIERLFGIESALVSKSESLKEALSAIVEITDIELKVAAPTSNIDPTKDEDDRPDADWYYEVSRELSNVSTHLGQIQEQAEHLIGISDVTENLKEQNELLSKQIGLQHELADIAAYRGASARNVLSGAGFTFVEKGDITNYEELLKQWGGKLPSDEVADALSEYQTATSHIYSASAEIQKAMYQQIANDVKALYYEIDVELDLSKAKRDYERFYNKYFGKGIELKISGSNEAVTQAEDALSDIKTYLNEDFTDGQMVNDLKAMQMTLDELEKARQNQDSIFGSVDKYGGYDDKVIQEQLQQRFENLRQSYEEVLATADSLRESWSSLSSTIIDAFDKIVSRFKELNTILEHSLKLNNLLNNGPSASANLGIRQEQEKNNELSLQAYRNLFKEQGALLKEFQDSHDLENLSNEDRNKYQELLDNFSTATQKLQEGTQEYYDAMLNTFNAQIDKTFEDAFGNYKQAVEEWEVGTAGYNSFLDGANRQYEMLTLGRKYDKSAENMSVKNQQKMQKLRNDELKYLKEKDKLTKADFERANLRYELMLKQIALEDAQNNKNTMRLRRDASGNYSYEFVANENDTYDKEQALNDAWIKYYNSGVQGVLKNSEEAKKFLSDWNAGIKDREAKGYTQEQIDVYNKDMSKQFSAFVHDSTESLKTAFGALGVADISRIGLDEILNSYNLDKNSFASILGIDPSALENNNVTATAIANMSDDQQKKMFATISNIDISVVEDIFDGILDANAVVNDDSFIIKENLTNITSDTKLYMDEVSQKWNDTKIAVTADLNEIIRSITGDEEGTTSLMGGFKTLNNFLREFNEETLALTTKEVKEATDALGGMQEQFNKIYDVFEKNKDKIEETIRKTKTVYDNFNKIADELPNVKSELVDLIRGLINAAGDAPSGGGGGLKNEEKTIAASYQDMEKWIGEGGQIYLKDKQGNISNIGSDEIRSERQYNTAAEFIDIWNKNMSEWYDGVFYKDKAGTEYKIIEGINEDYYKTNSKNDVTAEEVIQNIRNKFGTFNENEISLSAGPGLINESDFKADDYESKKSSLINLMEQDLKAYEDAELKWYLEDLQNDNISIADVLARYPDYRGRFDTGGYTGEWGDSSGRLAILHQKELVLNAQDTENILNAVSIMRTLQDTIFGMAAAAQSSQLQASYANDINDINSNSSQQLEQNVNITAEFPGVTSSFEIESALNNLVNVATQRAYRN